MALELLRQMRWSAALKQLMTYWKISRGPAVKDLAEAQRLLGVELDEKLPGYRSRSLERLERMLDRAEERGDLKAAVSAQREITRITGIAAPEKVEHSGGVALEHKHASALKLTPARRAQRERELIEKAGGAIAELAEANREHGEDDGADD